MGFLHSQLPDFILITPFDEAKPVPLGYSQLQIPGSSPLTRSLSLVTSKKVNFFTTPESIRNLSE